MRYFLHLISFHTLKNSVLYLSYQILVVKMQALSLLMSLIHFDCT